MSTRTRPTEKSSFFKTVLVYKIQHPCFITTELGGRRTRKLRAPRVRASDQIQQTDGRRKKHTMYHWAHIAWAWAGHSTRGINIECTATQPTVHQFARLQQNQSMQKPFNLRHSENLCDAIDLAAAEDSKWCDTEQLDDFRCINLHAISARQIFEIPFDVLARIIIKMLIYSNTHFWIGFQKICCSSLMTSKNDQLGDRNIQKDFLECNFPMGKLIRRESCHTAERPHDEEPTIFSVMCQRYRKHTQLRKWQVAM